MKADTWVRVSEVFEEALELAPDQRSGHLERACAGEPEVLAEVERLLRLDRGSSGFFGGVPVSLAGGAVAPPPGTRIGPYTIERVLASGGMGTVFEAVQDRPRRTVALKTLRLGLGSPERMARFQFEAEVLGTLRHAAIAQVYEAGTHQAAGEFFPYFAMELVVGALDLSTYARTQALSLERRIELFLTVCDAIHHGHQKGVIHRDLKPGNILVGADGQAKVIDFGVARVIGRGGDSGQVHETRAGQVVGTLQYMSPEQISGDPAQVDARTDVYSLGVVLYEFLLGSPPYDLGGLSLEAAARLIRETTPRRPRSLPKDLGWILLRSLEKDPGRRYAAVSELAADLRRFLTHDPVLAGAPSTGYRLGKLLRRHRLLLGATAAVIAALSLGLVRAERSARAEARARKDADALARAESSARAVAQSAAHEATAVNAFLDRMLRFVHPQRRGRDARVMDVLDEAARSIETEVPDDPRIRAMVHGMIGESYLSLGLLEEAAPHLASARDLVPSPLEGGDVRSIRAWASWGAFLKHSERLPEAVSWSRALLACAEERLGPEHDQSLRIRSTLAGALRGLGALDEAEGLLREGLVLDARSGQPDERRIGLLNDLAAVLLVSRAASRLEEAQGLLESAVELGRELLPEGHPGIQVARSNLVQVLALRGRHREAEELCRELLAWSRAHQGDDSFDTFALTHKLANVISGQGRLAEAQPLYEEALRIADAKYGSTSSSAIQTRQTLALNLWQQHELPEAEALALEALEIADRVLPADHVDRASVEFVLGAVLAAEGRLEESVEILRAATDVFERLLGPRDPNTLLARKSLVDSLGQAARWPETAEEAEKLAGAATDPRLQTWAEAVAQQARERLAADH